MDTRKVRFRIYCKQHEIWSKLAKEKEYSDWFKRLVDDYGLDDNLTREVLGSMRSLTSTKVAADLKRAGSRSVNDCNARDSKRHCLSASDMIDRI